MLIINDTNIWIDLKHTGLIGKVFKLPFDIGVPDILYYDELEEQDGELLIEHGINILDMTPHEIEITSSLSRNTNQVSFNDLTTLVVAKERNLTLVTGDGNLRKMATSSRVKLKGTLWLLDEMVENNVISKNEGVNACIRLKDSARRLPKIELDNRISLWSEE